MAKPKNKYYVVWSGREKGIYSSWDDCKAQISGFAGAKYKGFPNRQEAEAAFQQPYKFSRKPAKPKKAVGKPIYPSLSVDAACSGNPGIMEYQGVDSKSGETLFHRGPFHDGTNNVGEFLALVLGLAFLKHQKKNFPIYSDSRTAISWVRKKKCNTKLAQTSRNKELFEAIRKAEQWLKDNAYTTQILKWETEVWGEIPADFGRK